MWCGGWAMGVCARAVRGALVAESGRGVLVGCKLYPKGSMPGPPTRKDRPD